MWRCQCDSSCSWMSEQSTNPLSWFKKPACKLLNFNKHPIDPRELHIFARLVPERKKESERFRKRRKEKKRANDYIPISLIAHFGDSTEFLSTCYTEFCSSVTHRQDTAGTTQSPLKNLFCVWSLQVLSRKWECLLTCT